MIADAEIAIIGAGVMGLAIAYNLAHARRASSASSSLDGLPRLGRVGAQRRRRAPAVVDRDEHPPDAGVDRALRAASRSEMRRQRLVAPGRLPVPRAHAGRRARAWNATSRCRTAAACRRGCSRRRRRARSCPSSTGRAGFVGRLLQPERRHPVPVAVPVGLRARGREARRRDPHRRRRSPRSSAAPAAASGCTTPAGRFAAERVVNAAGAWSPEVARLVGRVAAQPPAPPRDPVDRAAQAVPEADGQRARDRPLLLAVDARRDRRRHLAAAEEPTRRRGPPRLAARVRDHDGARAGRR